MKKIIDDDTQKQLTEELEKRNTNIMDALKENGALEWIYSKVETPEEKELIDKQMNDLAEQMQPAVDFIYENLKVPGVAEKFYEQLMPHLKEMKGPKKDTD